MRNAPATSLRCSALSSHSTSSTTRTRPRERRPTTPGRRFRTIAWTNRSTYCASDCPQCRTDTEPHRPGLSQAGAMPRTTLAQQPRPTARTTTSLSRPPCRITARTWAASTTTSAPRDKIYGIAQRSRYLDHGQQLLPQCADRHEHRSDHGRRPGRRDSHLLAHTFPRCAWQRHAL